MAARGRRLNVITGEVPERFTREMGFTQGEFFVNLRAAFGDAYSVGDDGATVRIPVDAGSVTIRLGPQRERRIASLSLPFIEVEFCFDGLDVTQRRLFYTAFSRSFQRGGG